MYNSWNHILSKNTHFPFVQMVKLNILEKNVNIFLIQLVFFISTVTVNCFVHLTGQYGTQRVVNTIVSVPVMMCLDEINIWICRLKKAGCPSQLDWTPFSKLKAWKNKKADPSLSEREFLLSDCFKLGLPSFLTFRLKLKHQLSLGLECASF